MNIWHFDGNLGKDAELRTTNSGEKVLSLAVPSTSGFGERKKTEWVDCSVWGVRAEKIAPYLKKGTAVYIAGELSVREFQRKDGTPGSGLSVRVLEISFQNSRDGAAPSSGGYGNDRNSSSRPASSSGSRGGGKPAFDQDLDDEIPFIIAEELYIGSERFGKTKRIL